MKTTGKSKHEYFGLKLLRPIATIVASITRNIDTISPKKRACQRYLFRVSFDYRHPAKEIILFGDIGVQVDC